MKHYYCPTCEKSVSEDNAYWELLSEAVYSTMEDSRPAEYADEPQCPDCMDYLIDEECSVCHKYVDDMAYLSITREHFCVDCVAKRLLQSALDEIDNLFPMLIGYNRNILMEHLIETREEE